MKAEDIRDGDIVEIDYIEEFTKEHINKGKALVLWKGLNHQPLIMQLDRGEYYPVWTCYEYISKVVGHIPIGEILKVNAERQMNEKWVNTDAKDDDYCSKAEIKETFTIITQIMCPHCHAWFYKDSRHYSSYCPYCNVKITERGGK